MRAAQAKHAKDEISLAGWWPSSPPRRTETPRYFPISREVRTRDLIMRDEVLEHYAWIFCQGGFPNLAITFEQFLMVVATWRPSRFHRQHEYED